MADTKTETPADELRKAAAVLRETATKAIPGPWHNLDSGDRIIAAVGDPSFVYVVDEPMSHAGSAAWIALANPLLAEPLASWLETVADQFDAPPCDAEDGVCNGCEWRPDFNDALATARALNGSTP